MRVRHLAWGMLLSLPQLTLPPGQLQVPPSPTIQLVTDWWGTLSSFSALSLKSCPTLCDPMDCSPPCPSDHGIFQAGILEWVSTSYSGGSSRPGIEPASLASLALASVFFTAVPPGKSLPISLVSNQILGKDISCPASAFSTACIQPILISWLIGTQAPTWVVSS